RGRLARLPRPRPARRRHRIQPGIVLHRLPQRRVPGPRPGLRHQARPRGGEGPRARRRRRGVRPHRAVTRRDRERDPLTYADAGVDTAAGEKAVELIKEHVRSTFRPEVIGDVGGFGGLFALQGDRFRDAVLVASTDGVGTKAVVAQLAGRYDTIGVDCRAMSVDDVAANRAEPLFFLDYLSVGKLVPETIDEIVSGVADGCRRAGCALLGGERSEHGGVLGP